MIFCPVAPDTAWPGRDEKMSFNVGTSWAPAHLGHCLPAPDILLEIDWPQEIRRHQTVTALFRISHTACLLIVSIDIDRTSSHSWCWTPGLISRPWSVWCYAGCRSGMSGPQSTLQGPGSILKEVIQVQLDFDFKIEMDLDLASVAFPKAGPVVVSSLTEWPEWQCGGEVRCTVELQDQSQSGADTLHTHSSQCPTVIQPHQHHHYWARAGGNLQCWHWEDN